MIKKIFLIICVGLFSACALTKLTRGGYEEAPHEILKKDGSIELRKYPELQLVETVMANNQDNGFMRLFRYIDGGNDKKQKIAMTTPVFTSEQKGKSTMAFVLPEKIKSSAVPEPNHQSARRVMRPEMILAVRRYSGHYRDAPSTIESELKKWMENNNLIPAGEPIQAFYDPPWTPGFFRRNELLIPVINKIPSTREGHR